MHTSPAVLWGEMGKGTAGGNCNTDQIEATGFFQPSSPELLAGVLGLCSDLISFVIATALSCRMCGFSDVPELLNKI